MGLKAFDEKLIIVFLRKEYNLHEFHSIQKNYIPIIKFSLYNLELRTKKFLYYISSKT